MANAVEPASSLEVDRFAESLKTCLASLETVLTASQAEQRAEMVKLRKELADVKDRVSCLSSATDQQGAMPTEIRSDQKLCAQLIGKVLESKAVVKLKVQDDSTECEYLVPTAVMNSIPYFVARSNVEVQIHGKSWATQPLELLELQRLPPHCTQACVKALLSRLDTPTRWGVQEWDALGPRVALEVVLLADMWGLDHLAREAALGLRMIIATATVSQDLRTVCEGFAVPQAILSFLNGSLEASLMPEDKLVKMLQSIGGSAIPTCATVVREVFERRSLDGLDNIQALFQAVKSSALREVSMWTAVTRRTRNGSYSDTFYERELTSICGFNLLCSLVQEHIALNPDQKTVKDAYVSLRVLQSMHHSRVEKGDKLTEDTIRAIQHWSALILETGAEHVKTGRLLAEKFGCFVLLWAEKHHITSRVIAVLTDDHQAKLVSEVATSWFTLERVTALRDKARSSATHSLAQVLGSIKDDLVEFVRVELCHMGAARVASELDSSAPFDHMGVSSMSKTEASQEIKSGQEVEAKDEDGEQNHEKHHDSRHSADVATFAAVASAHTPQVSEASLASFGNALPPEGETIPNDKDAGGIDAELAQAIHQSNCDVSARENSDLAEALMRSKAGPPYCFSAGEVVKLRLTRHAQSPEVARVFNESVELADTRSRVFESGCDIQPNWAAGMWIFLPLTHEQFLEAELQPCDLDIIVRKSDEDAVKRALRTLPKPHRPKLRSEEYKIEDATPSSVEGECGFSDVYIVERTFVEIPVAHDGFDGCPTCHSAP